MTTYHLVLHHSNSMSASFQVSYFFISNPFLTFYGAKFCEWHLGAKVGGMFQFFSWNGKKPNTKKNFLDEIKNQNIKSEQIWFLLDQQNFWNFFEGCSLVLLYLKLQVTCSERIWLCYKKMCSQSLHFNKELFLWVEKLRHCFGVRRCRFFSIGHCQHSYQADPNMELWCPLLSDLYTQKV